MKRKVKRVRFAPGPLTNTKDGHPASEGRLAVAVRRIHHGWGEGVTKKEVRFLEGFLQPAAEYAHSIDKLKRFCGLLPKAKLARRKARQQALAALQTEPDAAGASTAAPRVPTSPAQPSTATVQQQQQPARRQAVKSNTSGPGQQVNKPIRAQDSNSPPEQKLPGSSRLRTRTCVDMSVHIPLAPPHTITTSTTTAPVESELCPPVSLAPSIRRSCRTRRIPPTAQAATATHTHAAAAAAGTSSAAPAPHAPQHPTQQRSSGCSGSDVTQPSSLVVQCAPDQSGSPPMRYLGRKRHRTAAARHTSQPAIKITPAQPQHDGDSKQAGITESLCGVPAVPDAGGASGTGVQALQQLTSDNAVLNTRPRRKHIKTAQSAACAPAAPVAATSSQDVGADQPCCVLSQQPDDVPPVPLPPSLASTQAAGKHKKHKTRRRKQEVQEGAADQPAGLDNTVVQQAYSTTLPAVSRAAPGNGDAPQQHTIPGGSQLQRHVQGVKPGGRRKRAAAVLGPVLQVMTRHRMKSGG